MKSLANSVTLALAFSATALLTANAMALAPTDFSDFPSDWSSGALAYAVDNGLLGGSNGYINPSGKLTRAELAAIVSRAFGATEAASLTSFQDAAADAWYYNDLAKAVQMGVLTGADGMLFPNNYVSREEAFTVLARAFSLADGDAGVLESFADSGSVSPWAKGSLAALIERGYVQGAEDNLNPQSQITRSEFAQLMQNLVGTFVDEPGTISEVSSGNVIIRTAGAVLKDVTITGDLILADGVGTGVATLNNVKIEGSLLVRGGGAESVHIENSEITGSVTLSNPNTTTRLVSSESTLGTVTVLSDIIVDGDMDKVNVVSASTVTVQSGTVGNLTIGADAGFSTIAVQNGASVTTVEANAPNITIQGSGKVSLVQANANHIAVTTPSTKVIAASGTSGVTAGGASVTPGTASTVGTAFGSSGGSSSGGSGSGGSSSGGNAVTNALAIENQTQIIDLGWAQYLVVSFENGFSLDNCALMIDGKDITAACTRVDDDGTIIKWELNNLHPQTLTLRSAVGGIQTIQLTK